MLEQPEIEGPVMRGIEQAARRQAALASDTSTLPVGDLAAYLEHAERFVGVHFSNPAPVHPRGLKDPAAH